MIHRSDAYTWSGTVTITEDDATGLSTSIDARGGANYISITIPIEWTAAQITFKASVDNLTFYDIRTDGYVELIVETVPGISVPLTPAQVDALTIWPYLKVRSGTSAGPVTQLTADKILTLMFERVD